MRSYIKQIGTILGIALSIFFIFSGVLAWTSPAFNPPDGNIAKLFNLSGETQTFNDSKTVKVKEDGTGAIDIEGGLGVHGIGDFEGNVSAPDPTADDHLATKKYVDNNAGNKILIGEAQSGKYIDLQDSGYRVVDSAEEADLSESWDKAPKVQTSIKEITTYNPDYSSEQQYTSYADGITKDGFYVYGRSVIPTQKESFGGFNESDPSVGDTYYSDYSRTNATKIEYSFSFNISDATSWDREGYAKCRIYYQERNGSWILYKQYDNWTSGANGTISGLPEGEYRFRLILDDMKSEWEEKDGDSNLTRDYFDRVLGDFNDWAEETVDNGKVMWIVIE